MEESILTSTKKILGIASSYTAFDQDILTHINATFSTLAQLGVGPVGGYHITDATPVWADYTLQNTAMLHMVKTYIYLKVRYLFDPPSAPYAVTAMKEQISEMEWRLNEFREEITPWVTTKPTSP
jgi:hypothetical protein